MLPPSIRKDLKKFQPSLFHVASPELLGHRAVSLARRWKLPVVASVHTRFETYFRYYGLAFLEPLVEAALRRFYRRCDAIFAPSESMAQLLREQRMSYDVGIWSRGIDQTIFNPDRRDLAWRRGLGIADEEPVIGFVGRLVVSTSFPTRSNSSNTGRFVIRCSSSAKDLRANGSNGVCRRRCSWASSKAPISAGPLPRWICCSTLRSPRHSEM
jgi:hypothetical protein